MSDATNTKAPVAAAKPTPERSSIDDEDMVLELSRFAFVAAWWSMMLVHASIAAFLFANNILYAYMGDMSLIYYNKLLDSDLAAQLARVGWVFSVVGGVHCAEMLKMVLFSLHARELSFRFQSRKQKIVPVLPGSVIAVRAATGSETAAPGPAAHTDVPAPVPAPEPKLRGLLIVLVPFSMLLRAAITVVRKLAAMMPQRVKAAARKTLRGLQRVRKALYDRQHGYMSVQSKYFNYLFLIRETIEIASQSYQMYNSATLLARPWVNAFFLALVVINCWSTPILQHVLAHSTGLERVMCLILDGLLDAGSAIVIPLIVFIPYAQAFDVAALSFPSDSLYDPQWFVNMVRENRMLFAMSKRDLFSKIVPHHSLYSCMKNIKKFIVRAPTASQRYSPSVPGTTAAGGDATSATTSGATAATVTASAKKPRKKPKKPIEYPGKGKRLVHVVFTLWGIAVLVIYLHARQVSVNTDVSACKLKLRPWFATTFSCASYTFDCHEQGQVDSLTSSDLAILHTDYLAALVIANCPALSMPSELQRFPNLLKFLIYNSSIAAWDASASINALNHTALVSICLVRVNMSTFPLGLQDSLPTPLQDIQVSTSNVTALPTALVGKWQPVTIIYFEHCDFAEFPSVLLQLRCDYLSLAGAKFAALPATTASAKFGWVDVTLSNNAELGALPTSGFKAGLQTLSIENTDVKELPSWVDSTANIGPQGLAIYAYNTPYCINKLASSASSTSGSGETGVVPASDTSGGVVGTSGSAAASTSAPTATSSTTATPTASGSSTGVTATPTTSVSSSGSTTGSTTPTTSGSGPGGMGGMSGGTVTVYCETRDPSGESRYPLALTTAAFQPQ